MKRDILNSPRLQELKRHRRKVFFRKILIYTFILVVVFIGVSYLFRISKLNISSVEITGNKVVEAASLQAAVEDEIGGRYLWIFPKTNIFFYPKNKIKKDLKNKFLRLKDVTVSVDGNQALQVSVSEREAKYTWCGESMPEVSTTDQKCYFLDQDGYIFDQAPYFSGDVYFKFYGAGELGSSFAQNNFSKLVAFKNSLEGMGLKPVAMQAETEDTTVFLTTNKTVLVAPKIIFKSDADYQTVAENLQAALLVDPLKSNLKNKYSALEYVDLRYGNKVYFKFH